MSAVQGEFYKERACREGVGLTSWIRGMRPRGLWSPAAVAGIPMRKELLPQCPGCGEDISCHCNVSAFVVWPPVSLGPWETLEKGNSSLDYQ